MKRYFTFLYVQNPDLRNYLNLAIYLLNPHELWPAHVTIAGPFDKPVKIPRSFRFMQQVAIIGSGRFEHNGRHSVFLRVASRNMSAHIEKPDYPDAIPHLTLYTGRDSQIADELSNGLSKMTLYGIFDSTHFEIVETGQKHSLNFRMQVDPDLLPQTRGKSLKGLMEYDSSTRVLLALEAIAIGISRSVQSAARYSASKRNSQTSEAAVTLRKPS